MQDPGGSGASAHVLVYRVRSLALLWKEIVLGATVDSGGPKASGLLMDRTVSPSSETDFWRHADSALNDTESHGLVTSVQFFPSFSLCQEVSVEG